MNDYKGTEVLNLLSSLSPDPLTDDVRDLYNQAFVEKASNPGEAIKLCERALAVLREKNKSKFKVSYAVGLCHLLIASIFLNQSKKIDLEQAKESFLESKQAFQRSQHSQYASLASLGLAIVLRKLGCVAKASSACEEAQMYIDDHSPPTGVSKDELRNAIKEERAEIQKKPELEEKLLSSSDEIILPIIKFSLGDKLIAAGRRGPADLNLLSRKDFEQFRELEKVIIDLSKRRSARTAGYVLEIDDKVEIQSDSLSEGDWLLIDDNPQKLRSGGRIAVLIRGLRKPIASLRIFIKDKDHFYLKGEGITSIVIARYKANFADIKSAYNIYQEKVIGKLPHDVHISGPIIREPIKQETINDIIKGFVWPIPIFQDVTKEMNSQNSESWKYEYLNRPHRMDADYFGFVTPDNAMENDKICKGDITLIRKDSKLSGNDIGVLRIETQEETTVVLRRYRYIKDNQIKNLPHWLLEASQPAGPHLVVISDEKDQNDIIEYYDRVMIKSDAIFKYYCNARVSVVGKYIETIKRADS
ncbi:MAG: hypothetical protein KDJ52_12220 [Anaerolineae bacterium]|nr:hypothetical protein [Anaerolineae bacterium]